MTSLTLVLWPDTRLAQRCDPVAQVGDSERALAADMLETMYKAAGRGLAAPQVGAMHRMFVMDATWKEGAGRPRVMINPTILAQGSAHSTLVEVCLSIPNVEVPLERPSSVTLQWQSLTGEVLMDDFEGAEARIIQHELDHLNGKVTLDLVGSDERARLLASRFG